MAKQKKDNTKETKKEATLQKRAADNLAERLTATPFTFMRRFGEEMDRLFEDFGIGNAWLTPMLEKAQLPRGVWSPQVEVFERDNQLVLRADLPGLTKDDLNVEVSDNGIVIEGERKNEYEDKGEGYYRSERSYGKFYRRIPLPEGARAEEASADFSNGVLEITIPAPEREPSKARRLEISGNGPAKAKSKAASGGR